MHSAHGIIKSLSSVTVGEELNETKENTTLHLVSHGQKKLKATGSETRNSKKWVIKSLEPHPKSKEEMFNSVLSRLMEDSPEINAIWDLPEPLPKFLAEEKERISAAIKEDLWGYKRSAHHIFVDIVLSEYMNFMRGTPYKSRLIVNEETRTIYGKMTVFVPGFKSFDDMLYKEIRAKVKELRKKSPYSTEVFRLLDKIEDIYHVFTILDEPHTPDPITTLKTFAQACVHVQRLDINDITATNIAMDEKGNILLLDNELGFETIYQAHDNLDEMKESINFETIISNLDFSNITHQPSQSIELFRNKFHYTDKPDKAYKSLRNYLGEWHPHFIRYTHRALLKEIIIPSEFIVELIRLASQIEVLNDSTAVYQNYLLRSKAVLVNDLLKNKDFLRYLKQESENDLEEILTEFKQAQAINKHYFENNEELAKNFLQLARDQYQQIIEQAKTQNLLETKEAPVEIKDNGELGRYGDSKLMVAVHDDEEEFAIALIQSGVDITKTNRINKDALYYAVVNRNMKLAKILLDILIEKKQFQFRSSDLLSLAFDLEHTGMITLLLSAGCHPNSKDKKNNPILFKAVESGNLINIELLLKAGADVDVRDTHGATPLFMAVCYRNAAVVDLLIQYKADVNAFDHSGRTVFTIATHNSPINVDIINSLKAAGADPTAMPQSRLSLKYVTLKRHKEDGFFHWADWMSISEDVIKILKEDEKEVAMFEKACNLVENIHQISVEHKHQDLAKTTSAAFALIYQGKFAQARQAILHGELNVCKGIIDIAKVTEKQELIDKLKGFVSHGTSAKKVFSGLFNNKLPLPITSALKELIKSEAVQSRSSLRI